MADSKVAEVDREVLSILNQKESITGPVHLGIHVLDTYDEWLALSTATVGGETGEYEIRFMEVYTPLIQDAKPYTKTTERTHNYEAMCYLGYRDLNSYVQIRDITSTVLDLLHNNTRPFSASGITFASEPPQATIDIIPLADTEYRVYVVRVTFAVKERIGYS